MNASDTPGRKPLPADRFALLWDEASSPPDVFAFLRAEPIATVEERLAVYLVDRQRRGRRGVPLPVTAYLAADPELAGRPDLAARLRGEETVPLPCDADPTGIEAAPGTEALDEFRLAAPTVDADAARAETRDVSLLATDGGLGFVLAPEVAADDELLALLRDSPRYAVLRRIGTGGMGVVYQVFDRVREAFVALKTMRQVDPLSLYRFKHEFRTLADLSHPNLVTLYDLVAEGDLYFFTMELIEGRDFVSHVRDAPCPADVSRSAHRLDRLRQALGPLAEGVDALHEAGKLHCDIKPTNVLVTPRGRVVLLDFGLSIEIDRAAHGPGDGGDGPLLGTVAYIAPEQCDRAPASRASDWYGVGVVLYQALTGHLPFDGEACQVLAAKRRDDPPPPREVDPEVPADLDALCVALLHRDPARRPCGPEVLERLGRVRRARPVAGSTIALFGRAAHRAALDDAFAAVQRGDPQTVYIAGRSGTGKSALLHSFLNDLTTRDVAVVLAGRCHERESVPYKALDGVVDALSRHLARLPRAELSRLLPTDIALLARVFPVLSQVEGVPVATRHADDGGDKHALRRRAFAALRALLTRLGAARPLVVAIDDLHWGEPENAVLLADLLRPPDPPVLLWIGCYRSEDRATSPLLRALLGPSSRAEPPPLSRELAVEPLTQSEARELARTLLGPGHPRVLAEAHVIARESGGNPFFIVELVNHVRDGAELAGRAPGGTEFTLDDMLWKRVERLPEDARRLLETIVVSGRPIPALDACAAAGLNSDRRAPALEALRAGRLIRAGGPAPRDEVEVYHDRIRETIAARLRPEVVTEHHRRLALTLEVGARADPEVLAGHFEGAGMPERAGGYYAEAADRAAEALAFFHAARLYGHALRLLGTAGGEARKLLTRLGDAQANAGRGADAAAAYRAAAALAQGAEALELRRRAALQLLISGRVDEGLDALQTVLAATGLALPRSPRRALAQVAGQRLWLRLRGLRFRTRPAGRAAGDALTRIDVCWSAFIGLSLIDPIVASVFQARGLALALRAGDPYRIARHLALEAAVVSMAGASSRRRFRTLMECAEPLAERVAHPQALGMIRLARAVAALMLGDWSEAAGSFDDAGAIFRDRCTGATWELDSAANLALLALTHLGDLNEVRRRWPVLLKEARRRGDLYALTNLYAEHMVILRLADDEPDDAERALTDVMAGWSRRGFHIQHSAAFRAGIALQLYRGEGRAAWDAVRAIWPQYHRAALFQIQLIRVELLELRGRAALAAAVAADDPAPLLRAAERAARGLERERRPWAEAHARLLRAAAAAARGELPRALTTLARAAADFDNVRMCLHAAVARRHLGTLLGGWEGEGLVRDADEALAEQGIRAPERFAAHLAPGFVRELNPAPVPSTFT